MKITRERKYTVNMGNYESLVIGGSVELDTDEVAHGENENVLDAAASCADSYLDQILAAEVKEAQELTHFDKSYILSYRVPQ